MTVEAIDLVDVRERVGQAWQFASVTGVLSAAHAMQSGGRANTAYVATSIERPTPNQMQGAHDQKVVTQLAVIACLAMQDKARDAEDKAEEVRVAVIDHLTAWTPKGAQESLDYAGYRILSITKGLVWLEISFTTSWKLRK